MLRENRNVKVLLLICPARVLIDDFHHIRHLTAPPPPRFVCLGAPLATCALPKGVCYLLTYLLVLLLTVPLVVMLLVLNTSTVFGP